MLLRASHDSLLSFGSVPLYIGGSPSVLDCQASLGCKPAPGRVLQSLSSISFPTSRSLLWYLRMLTVTTGATRSSRTGASGPGPVSPVRSHLSFGTGSGSRIPAALAQVSGPCSVVRDVVERGASESASVNRCWSGLRVRSLYCSSLQEQSGHPSRPQQPLTTRKRGISIPVCDYPFLVILDL
jgi:hypothetical protein